MGWRDWLEDRAARTRSRVDRSRIRETRTYTVPPRAPTSDYPHRGELMPGETATVLCARVEGWAWAKPRSAGAAQDAITVTFIEFMPYSVQTTLSGAPSKDNGTSSVTVADPVLDASLVTLSLTIAGTAYPITAVGSTTTCTVTGDASAHASGTECSVTVATATLTEIEGSRRLLSQNSMYRVYEGLFVSLDAAQEPADGSACPFDATAAPLKAVVTGVVKENDATGGRHLYRVQYTGYQGTAAAGLGTITKGPEHRVGLYQREYSVLYVAASTATFPGVGAVYGAESATDPLSACLQEKQVQEDQITGLHLCAARYVGLTGSTGALYSTLNGAPAWGDPSSTVTVDDPIFNASQIGQNLVIEATPYAITGVTSPTICTVTDNASGHGDETVCYIANAKWGFVVAQKGTDRQGENNWTVRESYAILSGDFSDFETIWFGARYGEISGNFAPYCRRIVVDESGWGIRRATTEVFKVDVYYWTMLKPGKARVLPQASLAGERVYKDTGGVVMEGDDLAAGDDKTFKITQGSASVLRPRTEVIVEVAHSSGFAAALNTADGLVGKVNSDACANILNSAAGELLHAGYKPQWVGPWGSEVLIIAHVLYKHYVGWNLFTKSRRFTRTQLAAPGPWIVEDDGDGTERTHPLYATTAFATELNDKVIWPT